MGMSFEISFTKPTLLSEDERFETLLWLIFYSLSLQLDFKGLSTGCFVLAEGEIANWYSAFFQAPQPELQAQNQVEKLGVVGVVCNLSAEERDPCDQVTNPLDSLASSRPVKGP